MNGTPNVGKHFTLKIGGQALVHCKTFTWGNSKGEIDITSRDSNGQREYILDGMIDKTLNFTAGMVRKGTSSSGVEFTTLLQNYFDSDVSTSYEIADNTTGGMEVTGSGMLKDLNINFGSTLEEVTCDGMYRINDASIGSVA